MSFHVRVASLHESHDIPGRFGEAGLRELAVALGEPADGDRDAWQLLARVFQRLELKDLAERLLDLVLLKPPIPAGCEALVRAMGDAATPPWLTHEVREDRVWLWYCHQLLHRALPDRFPPPTVHELQLEVVPLGGSRPLPGKRTSTHDRTAFVADLLSARPGALVLWPDAGAPSDWAFDVLWAVDVGDRERLADAAAAALGVASDAASADRLVRLRCSAWLPGGYLGSLHPGDSWKTEG